MSTRAQAGAELNTDYAHVAESALSDGEKHFRSYLENLPAGAYTCDPDGLITYYNQHAVKVWGRAPRLNDPEDRFCGSFKLYAKDGTPLRHDHCWMALALKTKQGYNSQEIIVQRPDGQRRVALAFANPIRDKMGKLLGAVNVLVDISDRKKAENAIRESRDTAQAASRAKDHFFAMLSHELRAPLSPIVMTVAVMEEDPELPAHFRKDLAMIRQNIDLEVKLIDDLLDVSRMITGKLRMQTKPVRVHDVLNHVMTNCENDFSGKRLKVHRALEAAKDDVSADPGRLQQVFWNLLRNAIKFTPADGEIFVSTRNDPDGGQVVVEVRDTGVGIAQAALPRVFEPFEQVEDGMTRQSGGLGLGLSIAKAVVEMHGGSITAASPGKGKGATFTVRLTPAAANHAKNHVNVPSILSKPSTAWRVLVVEDHVDTALILSRLLRSSGYYVQTAHSVASALQIAALERFDVVVSDIGLPDATGYDLMLQIKQSYGTKGIALSGYGMEEDVQRSRHAGFVEHVVKPVNLAQLEAVIQRLVTAA